MTANDLTEVRTLDLIIPGRPVPWARTSTHKGRNITPKRQREHRRYVEELAMHSMATAGLHLDDCPLTVKDCRCDTLPIWPSGPVWLTVWFLYKAPPRKRAGLDPMLSRPDLDNLVKQVKDCLTGLWWLDDAQVNAVNARKMYAYKEDGEQTWISARFGA